MKYERLMAVAVGLLLLLQIVAVFVPTAKAQTPPVLLDTAGSPGAVTFITTSTIAPTANALLIVTANGYAVVGVSFTYSISDTFTPTLTWTQVTETNNSLSFQRVSAFYVQLDGSPGSGTVTVTSTVSLVGGLVVVALEVTGHEVDNPVEQTVTGTSTAADLFFTFSQFVETDSLVIGALGPRDVDVITPMAGWTELVTADFGGCLPCDALQVQYGTGLNNVSWTGLESLPTPFPQNVGVALEINFFTIGPFISLVITVFIALIIVTILGAGVIFRLTDESIVVFAFVAVMAILTIVIVLVTIDFFFDSPLVP